MVQIVPNTKTGAVVSAYTSNKEFGYVQLQESATYIDGGWMRTQKRSALLRGRIEELEAFVNANPKLQVAGRICVQEFLESEVPQHTQDMFFNKSVEDYEERVKPYVKRAGNDGVELTQGGERILRFSFYDPSGKTEDCFTHHDNAEAIADARRSEVAAGATL